MGSLKLQNGQAREEWGKVGRRRTRTVMAEEKQSGKNKNKNHLNR
jgi:hypothetical protein